MESGELKEGSGGGEQGWGVAQRRLHLGKQQKGQICILQQILRGLLHLVQGGKDFGAGARDDCVLGAQSGAAPQRRRLAAGQWPETDEPEAAACPQGLLDLKRW